MITGLVRRVRWLTRLLERACGRSVACVLRLGTMRVWKRAKPIARALPFALLFAATDGDAAPGGVARHAHIVEPVSARRIEYPDAPTRLVAWAAQLPAIDVKNRNTNARAQLRLYANDGELDSVSLHRFMRIAASVADLQDRSDGAPAEPLDPRLVQLVVRASYHFGNAPITIVSATRKGAHGKHGSGDALDFQLEGVRASTLAAYVRTYPRAGVGIYTHPKTQYVHVDVRDRSYHWLDGSPPGVTWRERLLPDRTQAKRDDSYVAAMDLPEAAAR
jgi:uncharacterized protein YcbK (DUF882 family)